MIRAQQIFLAAAVACLALASVLKVGRYAGERTPARIEVAGRIAEFLVEWGWQPAGPLLAPPQTAYASLTFQKAGCEDLISIAVLGNSAELEPLVRAELGDDLAFVQQGRILPRPDPLGQRLDLVWHAAGALIGLTEAQAIPILAVSPAPGAAATCAPPPGTHWRELRG